MKIKPNLIIVSGFNALLVLIAPALATLFSFLSGMPIPNEKKNIMIFAMLTVLYTALLYIAGYYSSKIGYKSVRHFAICSFVVFAISLMLMWYFLIEASMGI